MMAERDPEPEIATTTLAEIYVQQGLFDRALAIYHRIAERSPGDARVMRRLVEIEGELERARADGDGVRTGGERAAAPPLAPAVEPAIEPAPPVIRSAPPACPPVAEDAEFLAWLGRR